MKFLATDLAGVFVIEIEPNVDHRGFFARLWCEDEFGQHGLATDFVQSSVCHNGLKGTLRGLHFQWPPCREAKLVRCIRGSVYDVVVDLRPDSATFTQHFAVVLDSEKHNAVYVPAGFAHAYQTLEHNSDLLYMMSDFYRPELSDGFRYDDSAFEITWPLPVECIAERDKLYPDFNPEEYAKRYTTLGKNSHSLFSKSTR
ncbi:dTDP-4-dehydrorhamnose 3,5-epimerase family protein [Paraglaciecola hydrolytica]|uniref:dTDP-4-dehydrorhamnose 3,5-epimerase family protein n=1 Tax=Paraglaciecola hydrolytica TaxID=1799789 RepID=UPI000838CE31|nr:dTDP-4-dehydrorhamnose 3,5-epimerase family protein [Paraglaciecola hydrolytica]